MSKYWVNSYLQVSSIRLHLAARVEVMGSLQGHLLTGGGMLVLGMRWFYCLFLRYFLCRREASLGSKDPKRFRSSLVYPWSVLPGLPMDGVVITAVCGLGMIGAFFYFSTINIDLSFFIFCGIQCLRGHNRYIDLLLYNDDRFLFLRLSWI